MVNLASIETSCCKVKETLGARAYRISTKIFHKDEDARFLEFVKYGYDRELPEKSRKLIYFKRDRERDFAILSLFLGSGIRVNELSNLRLRDFNFEEKQIHALRKGGKKDVVAVSPPSMQDIKDYLAVRTERYRGSNDDASYVFLTRVNDGETPLSNRAIEALVKKYTKSFKSNKSMSPHKLRHTYGTNLMEQSGNIHLLMTQLGHTSTTTAALYTNPEQEKAKKAAKQLGERRTNYREKD